ncbi:MAG: arylesterase [Gammaproteobacteria bacterium]|nr:arylesterase [Gammaproteobacteria bacterium]
MIQRTGLNLVLWIGVMSLLVLLTGCSRSTPAMTRLDDSDVILAFGDSLTYGTGVSSEFSYPSILAGRIGKTVINEGIPGELSKDGLPRLAEVLEQHHPQLVIICHGGNDFLRKQSVEALENNLKQMIQLVREQGAEVMLIAVPEPNLLMLSDAEVYSRVAESMNVAFVDHILSEILSDNALKSDTVHPNAQGYQHLALAVESVLSEVNAI